jgi:ribosomal protein S18 acetylase RimI-like enzyme
MTQRVEVTTRLARATDAPQIDRLLAAYRAEVEVPQRKSVELDLSGEGPLFLLVAESHPPGEPGDLVGMLVAHCCFNFMQDAPFLLLTDIYVESEQRRSGVAGALLQMAEALAMELECISMSIIVAHINDAALTTAARAGFYKHDELLISRAVD